MLGFVKWFASGRGYGFITAQDGEDHFCHYTGIVGEGYRNLEKDQECEFDLEKDNKGRTKAINIREINNGQLSK